MTKILITNCIVLPMTIPGDDAAKYFKGSVALAGNRIAVVARDDNPADRQRIEEFRTAAGPALQELDGGGKILLPGLINTHTHVSMTLLRNYADDMPLMPWLVDHIWPFEAHLGPGEIATGARLGMVEMLLGGTTTLVDMYWHEAAVGRAALDTGIRAVLCPSFLDGERMAEFERDLDATLRLAAGSDTLSVRIAPHAVYTCSEANLRRGMELARHHGIGLHIHLSETLDEQRMVRERHGCTPTEYLRDIGFFEPRSINPPSAFRPTIAAHCVHVCDSDIEILRTHGVTAAHNPQSNMKLASGAAPVARMLAAGVNVSLGTDGASSNNDLDMWDEMRTASLLGKLTAADSAVMPAYEVLKMATVNGARAIGMEGSLGVIAEGALADFLLLDMDKPHFYPHNDPVAALVYCAKSSDVDTVFVSGRRVVSAGRVTGLDIEVLRREVDRTVAAVKQKL